MKKMEGMFEKGTATLKRLVYKLLLEFCCFLDAKLKKLKLLSVVKHTESLAKFIQIC